MNNLWQKINNDLTTAIKQKQSLELSVIRLLLSAINYKKIAIGKGADSEPLADEQIVEVISSEIKKRKDSIEAYTQGGRLDLAQKEKTEMGILEKYLPTQLSDVELEKIITEVISGLGEVGVKDIGRIIGQVMPKVRGQADGGRVSAMVKRLLAV